MALFRTLDENGDMTFGKGLNNYSKNNNAVKLNIQTRIKSWIGDCFFALNDGIDWWNRLGSKDQLELLEQDLKNIILNTEEVTEIVEFSISLNNRKFIANYTVNTIYSQQFSDLIERTL